MAFKPKQRAKSNNTEYEQGNFPTPKAGNRKARVSLIVDLGIQAREAVYKKGDEIVDEDTEGAVKVEQKPCQQVAVFADLVNDVVDYGGKIGEAQYRLMLNKTFSGTVQGINFTTMAPKDPKTKATIKGKPWSFAPQSVLTKLAKAVGKEHIIYDDRNNPDSLDIDLLLGEPFLCLVEVKETASKDKKDEDGNPIIYKNVNFKGASQLPLDDYDQPVPVADLRVQPMSITFDNAEKDDIMYIRPVLRKMIKNAENYAGSQMQKAMEAFEADQEQAASSDEDEPKKEDKKATKPAGKTSKAKATPPPEKEDEEELEDAPF